MRVRSTLLAAILALPAAWALAIPARAQAPRLLSPRDLEAHVQRPVPSASPDPKWLAYEVSVSGTSKELYAQPLSGGAPVALAPGGGSRFGGAGGWVCHEAAWDPRGKARLVLSCGDRGVGNYDLYVAELFGSRATLSRLTTDDANEGAPAWTLLPGADVLLYTSGRTGNGDVYRLDLGADGAQPVRLTRGTATDDFAVPGSAAGTFLFVQRTSQAGGEGVYLGQIDSLVDAVRVADWPGSDETNPSLSPDGATVAFFSNKGHRAKGHDAWDLYVVPASGGEPRMLTAGVRKGDGLGPAWLPDGTALVAALADPKRRDPLALVSLADGARSLLATGTEMNGDVVAFPGAGGGAILAFTAQGRVDDRVKRWRRLYVFELPR